LKHGADPEHSAALKTFGDEHNWDWKRLPEPGANYPIISDLVEQVRQEYLWFGWRYHEDDPSRNRGHYYNITVSSESGLPWIYDFINLAKLKENIEYNLGKCPTYKQINNQFKELLLTDSERINNVVSKAKYDLHKDVMHRNFYEQLAEAELLCENRTEIKNGLKIKKVLDLGGETLWNLSYGRLSSSLGMYQVYTIDLWQDIREPQIVEDEQGNVTISPELRRSLKFSEENAAWYVISELDKQFKSVHPVHVSKMLVGPYENKYLTKPDEIRPLKVTSRILVRNSQVGLLRASIKYSYAPNHEVTEKGNRQIVYREDWSDEIVVCPAAYSSLASKSLLGDRVRIFES